MKIVVTSSSNNAINADLVKSFHVDKIMDKGGDKYGIFADDVCISRYVIYDNCKKAFRDLISFLTGIGESYTMEDNK